MDWSHLKGKWALITGASRGIGQQIAWGLAELGVNLVLQARTKEGLSQTVSRLKGKPVEYLTIGAELSLDTDIERLIAEVCARLGGIDILYNNAAVMSYGAKIWEIPLSEWYRVLEINLFAVIRLCNAFAPLMKKRGWGRIINITSGIKDQPDFAPYSVSKAAIDKYSRDLAWELKGTGVLVNYLDPGWLKTDLGGPNAMFEVETVLPGALVPVLLEDNGPTGQLFCAQDYKYLKL